MDYDQSTDYELLRIKENLNQNKVKLWLTPYYTEKGVNENEMKELAQTFSSELSIPSDVCLECLYRLQRKALDNIKQQNNYKSTGVATVNVKVHSRRGVERILTLGVKLSITGFSLKKLISKEAAVSVEMLKVIFQGKILKDEETLESQGLKNGHHLMAIVLGLELNLSKHESNMRLLDSVKNDVKLLTRDKVDDDDYLQVADQSGKLLKLPENERTSLILAMTLHEKGRAAIKEEDFPIALFLLLEAEKEFSYCNSNLLKSVDNYGLLNLDIVWCYLNLKSVTQLPDAEQRLYQCESSFHQSYGPNLERLIALKGSAGNEKALFMRLHLLQAIVLYHQNKFNQARELLEKVEQELKCLEVDDFQLSYLVELGYGVAEARLALRQANGDLNAAITIIENKRVERKKNEEAEKKEKELLREKKKLGKCMDGEWIEPQFHKALMSMGYSYEVARWALAQSCNSICNAVNLIQEHPDFLPGTSQDVTDDAVAKVSSLGFERASAEWALQKHKGDVEKAIEELVGGGAALEPGKSSDSSSSSSSSSSSGDSSPTESKRKQKEAYSRVSAGISTSAEDHLDLSLTAEKAFLQKYRDLLSK